MVQAWLPAVSAQEAGRAADALVALVTEKALTVSNHRLSPQSLPAPALDLIHNKDRSAPGTGVFVCLNDAASL
jgi:hypothetical protein